MATKPTDAVNRIAAANGNAYDLINNPGGLAQGGHRQNFVPDLQATVAVAQWSSDSAGEAAASATATAADRIQTGQDRTAASNSASSAAQSVSDAAAQVSLAANQVTLAAAQAQRFQGTSTSNVTPSIGSKTFVTQAGKAFDVGTTVLIQSRGNLDRWMTGRVTAYSGTSLTVAVDGIGSVTNVAIDWDIRVTGARGVQGIQGPDGIVRVLRSPRTANSVLVNADSGKLIDVTSGTFTQTFASAATLTAGWFVDYENSGTGTVTLDPNGSELIDGATTLVLKSLEVRRIICDGSAFYTLLIDKPTPPAKFESALFHVRDEKAAGSSGGGATDGAFNTRTLNTILTNEIGASISSNIITIPAGTYYLDANAPAYGTISHKLRLFNVTDNSVVIIGGNEYNNSGNAPTQTRASVSGRFTVSDAKQIRLEHYTQGVPSSTQLALGFDNPTAAGIAVFADLKLWKVV